MYSVIFQDVIEIMHHDYAGCKDKRSWDNPQMFKQKINELDQKGELDDHLFAEIVEDYLLDFQDPHMFFNVIKANGQKSIDNGFKVRRFGDKLFVTSVLKKEKLNRGDAIVSLDHTPVKELAVNYQRELMETEAEREDWRRIIQKHNVADVLTPEGKHKSIQLNQYEKADYTPKHTITRIDSETLLMTLTDFFDAEVIDQLIDKHQNSLMSTKNLIVDVRTNYGGSSLAYEGLEKYLFPAGSTQVHFSDYENEFNCTERNTELMIDIINQTLENIDHEEYRNGLERYRDETWVNNKGKGFISFDDDEEENEMDIKGLEFPENVVVLTDSYCGSAGDIFVYLCKQSPKVTVVGRPTKGVNDYSDLTIQKWHDKFGLGYPTSRLKSLERRGALNNPGIKPDVYIPWTPEHINKDVDMEKALSIFRGRI
ncbi:S41 family peptidase [Alkalibacillus salilacus]|uniref:C-terminal processing protease CtpA/Prc n=1 Tax=Alkalibacillus salilacus TaxID=284582 RepID=A0ABT9VIK7_9BACI|nr:S41 family peptidase [Alkalibacillus salilacus]MDQ0160801.1 C-terminal processing protease CtpA/Prc [Alkalibacillus salilacus]